MNMYRKKVDEILGAGVDRHPQSGEGRADLLTVQVFRTLRASPSEVLAG